MKRIVTDIKKLSDICEGIDTRKQNELMREIILALNERIENDNPPALSAPQLGYKYRLFCINFNGKMKTFINPIISQVDGFDLSREKCCSIPGKEFIRPRNTKVTVIYQTPLGKAESTQLLGMAARVFQEQMDHLDGLLLSDIGLELPQNFDQLSDDEKEKLITDYMKALDIQQKEIEKEIKEDKVLNDLQNALEFTEGVKTGKIKIERDEKK